MFQQFNISRSGFGVYQKMMFNITNNIANAQTPGFKQTRVELATLFPVILQEAEVKYADDEDLNDGSIQKVSIVNDETKKSRGKK